MKDVFAQPVQMHGEKDVPFGGLFGPQDHAPTFAMRLFKISPGDHTPFHTHEFEHEVIILDDDIAVVAKEGTIHRNRLHPS